jgi:SAM-dependent methyltransferase
MDPSADSQQGPERLMADRSGGEPRVRTKDAPAMTTAEAIEHLRREPAHADLIRDSYLEEDTLAAAERFERSGEFEEVRRVLGDRLQDAGVLDLGAGTGIGSFALARAGARRVHALEPDPSPVVGRGAMTRLEEARIEPVAGAGEDIPLDDASVDVVYARQVLHHITDLVATAREIRRVLRPGGVLLACREHVIDSEADLETFLANHEVHQLAGGEAAYPIETYLTAMNEGGLRVRKVWQPMDSVINAFPLVRSRQELIDLRVRLLGPRLGRVDPRWAGRLPLIGRRVRRVLEPYVPPGSMWSFLAERVG